MGALGETPLHWQPDGSKGSCGSLVELGSQPGEQGAPHGEGGSGALGETPLHWQPDGSGACCGSLAELGKQPGEQGAPHGDGLAPIVAGLWIFFGYSGLGLYSRMRS